MAKGSGRRVFGAGLVVALAGCVLSGCTTPWQQSFEPTVGVRRAAFAPTEHVKVREVPWERVADAMNAIQERMIASDIHPNDWGDENNRWVQQTLLTALQLQYTPDEATVFGLSKFSTTDQVRPTDGELGKYAASIGADFAVWSDRYLGKAETIVREPVQRSGWSIGGGYRGGYGGHDDRWRSGSYTETVWLPVTVLRDESAYIAFYVRVH